MVSLIPFNRSRLTGTRSPSVTNMLDDFFNDQWPFARQSFERSLMSDTFKVDVRDAGKEYVVEAEMPGVKKDEVGLSIDEGRLVISVNRNEETGGDENGYIHRERRSVSMSRSVYLADSSEEGVSAKLEDGVLRVVLPKAAPVETRREISIQ